MGALSNLGHTLSDQTVGNTRRRHGIAPAPERSRTKSWKEFIQSHAEVLAGTDFFTVEVLTWRGLVTHYVLFFIELDYRSVDIYTITTFPCQNGLCHSRRGARLWFLAPMRSGGWKL
jgi:putative transposase